MFPNPIAMGLVDVGDNINFASALVVIVAMLLQTGVFITCIVLLARLWGVIFAAFEKSDEPKARILLQLLGAVSAEGNGKPVGRAKLAGSGALGTILILFFGCMAIYLIGHHSAGVSKSPAKPQAGVQANAGH